MTLWVPPNSLILSLCQAEFSFVGLGAVLQNNVPQEGIFVLLRRPQPRPTSSSPPLILTSPAATVQLALGKRIVMHKLKEAVQKSLALMRWLEPLVANNWGYVVYFLLSKGRTLQSLRPNLPFFACSCCGSNISGSLGSSVGPFGLFRCYPWN